MDMLKYFKKKEQNGIKLNSGDKQYLVIGCGRFGTAVAKTLEELGYQVMAIDRSEEAVQKIADKVTYAATVDVTDESALVELGISNFDCVIVAIGSDFRAAILATLASKEKGVPHVVCKVADDIQSQVMTKIGADQTIMPERDAGKRLARNLISDNVLDQIELGEKYTIYEIHVPNTWIGKSLAELDLRARKNIAVIAIKRNDEVMLSVRPDQKFLQNDIAVVAGTSDMVKHFKNATSLDFK